MRRGMARRHGGSAQRPRPSHRALGDPCSTAFLYGHAELKRRITHLREQQRRATLPVPRVDPDAPSSVVRTLTSQIAALKRRHRDEVAQLRHDLAAAHGEILALRRKLGEQRR